MLGLRLRHLLLIGILACASQGAQAELTQGSKYIVVGGGGDGSGKSDLNGGAYRGSVSWSEFQDANGGPVDVAVGAAAVDNGSGQVRIVSAGAFDDAKVDIFAHCRFDATYPDGVHAVVAVDPAGNYIDVDLPYLGDAQADVNVGGALENPQTAVDRVDQGDCVKISGGPYVYAADGQNIISCSVAVDGEGSPAYAAMWNTITIEGVNENGELDWNDKVVLDCSVNGVKTGVDVSGFYRIRNLEIIGSSSTAISRGGVDNVIVEGCAVRSCGGGAYLDNNCSLVRCVFEENAGRGVYADNNLKIIGCVFRNNGGGVRMNTGEILYSTISNNQPDVSLVQIAAGGAFIAGVTLDGGGQDGTCGINFSNIGSGKPQVFNSIISNCQTGLLASSDITRGAVLYNNLYHGNVDDVAPNGFVTTGVNAVFGDPAFADAASGDYRLLSGSAAIGMGFDSTVVQFGAQDPYDSRPTGASKIIAVGGRGDGSGASDANGGAYAGDVTWSEFQGPNGGPLDSAAAASVGAGSDNNVRISSPGAFAHSLVDVYAFCDFGSIYDDGTYAVVAVDPNGDYIEIDLDYAADDTADVNVGGALASPQQAVDSAGQGDYVKIAGGPYTASHSGSIINCTVAVDTAATGTNRITVEGVNADGVIDWADKVVLDCRVEGASHGLSYPANYRIRNFEVIGAGSTAMGNTSVDSCVIEQCVAREGAGVGLQMDNGAIFVGCESYNNASMGFDGDGAVNLIGCIARNNRSREVAVNYGMVMFSTLSNNESAALLIRMSEQWTQPWYVVNNTLDGGDQSGLTGVLLGMNLASTSPFVVMNNCITHCEDGLECYGDMTRQTFFYNNLYFGNVNPVSLNGNASAGYDAVFGDPNFADPDVGDYTLGAGSAATNAGFDSAWTLYGESGMAAGASGLDAGSHQRQMFVRKPGDANGDDAVNIDDFVILKNNFGAVDASWSQGDFNGDGVVNINDFVILKNNFGS